MKIQRTIKIDEKIFMQIEQFASNQDRSINNSIEVLLKKALKSSDLPAD